VPGASWLYLTVPCCTLLCSAVPRFTLLYPGVPCCTPLYPAIPRCTLLYPALTLICYRPAANEEREGQLLGVDLAVGGSSLHACAPRRQFTTNITQSKLLGAIHNCSVHISQFDKNTYFSLLDISIHFTVWLSLSTPALCFIASQ
jgi:hypothetical protein